MSIHAVAGRPRRRVAAAAAFIVLIAASPSVAAAALAADEVKAAALYHFAHLVEWPAPSAPGHQFVIGVVGDDPFLATLEQTLAGKSVRGQPVCVERFAGPAEIDGGRMQILFVGHAGGAHVRRTLKAVVGQPVLTVGESPRFAERGGMIGFRVSAEGRVAFDINRQRAHQSGLRMSSQLLKLARIVGPGR